MRAMYSPKEEIYFIKQINIIFSLNNSSLPASKRPNIAIVGPLSPSI